MKKLVLVALVVLVLAALAVLPRQARAHVVPTGVGSQSEIRIGPRKVTVKFNMGFSSLLGIRELKLMDADGNREIDRQEQERYLSTLGPKLVEGLRCHLDGKPLRFKIVRHSGTGLLGPIDQVAFDTFYDLEADVEVGAGKHELKYYEGNYPNEDAQQILWLPFTEDYREFFHEQEQKLAPEVERDGVYQLQGRDVTIRFELDPDALERARADQLLEKQFAGLQGTIDTLAGQVAAQASDDASVLVFEPAKLGRDDRLLLGGGGFTIKAFEVAKERVPTDGASPPPPPAPIPDRMLNSQRVTQDPEVEEGNSLIKMSKEPFSLAVILAFLLAGMVHATGAGHGKSMVAAYLLGTSGRAWDAVRLGLIVTFTHTFTLYTLGLGLVFIVEWINQKYFAGNGPSQQVVQKQAMKYLTLFSGLGLVSFGLSLAYRRWQSVLRTLEKEQTEKTPPELPKAQGRRLALAEPAPVAAPPSHDHAHGHDHDHGHDHGDGHHHHHHDGHSHSHSHSHEDMDEAEHAAAHAREASANIASWADLLRLGITGGMVPCPAGIMLIIYSLSLKEQNTLRCFVYLNAFSLGLGAVLIGIALTMVFSKPFLESAFKKKERRRALLWLPVVSAVLVSFVGWSIVYEAFDPSFKKLRARAWAALGYTS